MSLAEDDEDAEEKEEPSAETTEDQAEEARSESEVVGDDDEDDAGAASMLGTSAGDMAIACPRSRNDAESTGTKAGVSLAAVMVAVDVVGAAVPT